MQTKITPELLSTRIGEEANSILRSCVHCGFCTATCPTYQLLGDELDGPRGRLYLIKEMMERGNASSLTLQHLDRCLTCRSCETTCPSGVRYSHLLSLGRELAESYAPRPLLFRLKRMLLLSVLPYRNRFLLVLKAARLIQPLLPARIRKQLPVSMENQPAAIDQPKQMRSVLLFEPCVQPGLSPGVAAAARAVLNHLGISTLGIANQACCGAVDHHLNARERAEVKMRSNIDAWWPLFHDSKNRPEAIVITASACTLEIKEYGELLCHDLDYAEKAAAISAMAKDLAEIITTDDMENIRIKQPRSVAFHAPCTLQHGQKLAGVVEQLLTAAGFELTEVRDSHLCCGSAGTYSLLQPEISGKLRDNRVAALTSGNPEVIATANVGCQSHLRGAASLPVLHWIELIANEIDHG